MIRQWEIQRQLIEEKVNLRPIEQEVLALFEKLGFKSDAIYAEGTYTESEPFIQNACQINRYYIRPSEVEIVLKFRGFKK